MEHVLAWFKAGITIVGGLIGAFLGGFDGVLIALLVFIGIDIATGILRAIYQKQLNSKVSWKGMCKKVTIILLVGMGWIIDLYVVKSGGIVRTAIIFFYIANEGISILENVAQMGMPIPKKVKDVLEQIRKKAGEDSDDEHE
jgi:toxin secretion/phage lysis holin